MTSENYYLASALPSLADLGSEPPLSLAALREQVSHGATARTLVDAILLGDDLLQRDAALAGESRDAEPALLTAAQVRNEKPLPTYLAPAKGDETAPIASDAVWEAYFRHADAVARMRGSRFLAAWVGHEVALRNALAARRAETLNLDPDDYRVAPELGDAEEDFADLLGDWAGAKNPLEGSRILDTARWRWLNEHDAWFSFSDDELAAYAARLMLLIRWHRLSKPRAREPG